MFVDRGGSRHTEPNRQAHRLLQEKKNASQQQNEGCCEPRSTEWALDSIRAASPRQQKKYVGFAGNGAPAEISASILPPYQYVGRRLEQSLRKEVQDIQDRNHHAHPSPPRQECDVTSQPAATRGLHSTQNIEDKKRNTMPETKKSL